MRYKDRLKEDWDFTNKIHEKLVAPLFQDSFSINFKKADIKSDQERGIDYIGFKNKNPYTFQERIRRSSRYTDNSAEFTLRFKREKSISSSQSLSEFFKIEAQFLFYAIVDKNNSCFQRYCIINIRRLKKAINDGLIVVDNNIENKKHTAYLKNNTPHCIVKMNNENKSGNSSFIIFNVNDIINSLDKNKEKKHKIVIEHSGYQDIKRKRVYKNKM